MRRPSPFRSVVGVSNDIRKTGVISVRRWVLPAVRLLLVAVVAVALVKLAFFPDRVEQTAAVPTGTIVEPTIPVALGTIVSDVVVPATVSPDPAIPVKSTAAGKVDEVFFAQGSAVQAGDVLFDVKLEIVRSPEDSIDAEGRTKPPIYRFEKVTAPASGVVSSLGVIAGQDVTVGMVAAQVAPPTFSISGALAPEQRYRLVSQPADASITISGGPAPFTCTGLRITTPLPGSDSGGIGSDGGVTSGGPASAGAAGSSADGGSATTATCPVPGDVTVFPGLAAEMTIAGGKAENAVVVPTTAVRGAALTGVVWVSRADGGTEERAVGLGLTDGEQVEITSGLAEGDTILQFAPGAPAVVEDCPADSIDCVPSE
jgi:macrolide-specific efflux system membrane fusion protein